MEKTVDPQLRELADMIHNLTFSQTMELAKGIQMNMDCHPKLPATTIAVALAGWVEEVRS